MMIQSYNQNGFVRSSLQVNSKSARPTKQNSRTFSQTDEEDQRPPKSRSRQKTNTIILNSNDCDRDLANDDDGGGGGDEGCDVDGRKVILDFTSLPIRSLHRYLLHYSLFPDNQHLKLRFESACFPTNQRSKTSKHSRRNITINSDENHHQSKKMRSERIDEEKKEKRIMMEVEKKVNEDEELLLVKQFKDCDDVDESLRNRLAGWARRHWEEQRLRILKDLRAIREGSDQKAENPDETRKELGTSERFDEDEIISEFVYAVKTRGNALRPKNYYK
ncbi:hypothetical protein BY996DRAFT_6643171 [Phakopsora pachyrhizi]|uniref:Uncharacterized protein n=1 Tax=Phakopsora pachyrhizi TaxID=170000 RepID=A0AAV0BGB9_PHAPC|nr:hypothetical protein BY996DRAFT_6643171 [Phakopsora pachyrhizi]CAH7686010.1 hypothetical protein PPACK8108_LOCUS20605 [Phakopsora pachyrhizi]